MKRGLMFPGGGMTMQDIRVIAQAAEETGFDSLYCVEAWRGAFVPLAAIACSTTRVRIGSYVLNAYARSPYMAGMNAIDLDELSGGRLLLGVGSGNQHINEAYQGLEHARPLTKMAEYIQLLRRIVRTKAGEQIDFDGKVHSMHWAPAVTPLRESIPVYQAAIYPKMLKVAARHADGLALGALLSAAYIRDSVRPAVASAAEEHGRDPGEIGFVGSMMVSVDDDADAARNVTRQAICSLYSPLPHPYYDWLLREQGFSSVADQIVKHVADGNQAAAAEAIPDEMITTLSISGNAKDCAAAAATYEGLVDEIILTNVGAVASTLSGSGPSLDVVAAYRAVLDLDLA
jgi:5,10-methylenetetrahydromethanopterin reductase